MIAIPTQQTISARWNTPFDANSNSFILHFYWSTRESAWYFDINDSNDIPILVGTKIVPGIWLLRQFITVRNIMGGDFVLIDQKNNPAISQLTFDNFGVRYLFVYSTITDMSLLPAVV